MGRLLTHSGAKYPLVPLTIVTTCECSLAINLASPKSDTLGQKFSSRRMFSGLMSQCIILSRHCSWKYAIPCAVPIAIWKRVDQSSSLSWLVGDGNIHLSKDPFIMNSYTRSLQNIIFQCKFQNKVPSSNVLCLLQSITTLSLDLQYIIQFE